MSIVSTSDIVIIGLIAVFVYYFFIKVTPLHSFHIIHIPKLHSPDCLIHSHFPSCSLRPSPPTRLLNPPLRRMLLLLTRMLIFVSSPVRNSVNMMVRRTLKCTSPLQRRCSIARRVLMPTCTLPVVNSKFMPAATSPVLSPSSPSMKRILRTPPSLI